MKTLFFDKSIIRLFIDKFVEILDIDQLLIYDPKSQWKIITWPSDNLVFVSSAIKIKQKRFLEDID